MKIFNRQLLISFAMVLGGIMLMWVGVMQEGWSEKNGLKVNATITDIEERRDDVGDDYVYYGKYVVGDKLYTDKYLKTQYGGSGPNHSVGDMLQIKVDPSKPSALMGDGSIFFILGMVVLIYGGFWLYFEWRFIFN